LSALSPPLLRATAVTLVANFPSALTGALSVQIAREFAIPAATVASFVGVFFAAACVSSIALGRLVEHIGPRAGMQAVAALTAASLGLAGLAGSPVVLALALVVGGVATAIVSPAAHVVVAAEVPFRNQGVAFGMLRAAQPGAILVGGLAVPTVGLTIGWNAAFLIGAAIAVLMGLAVTRWQRALPRAHDAEAAGQGRRRVDLGNRWNLVVLAVAMALASGVVNVVGPFFVPSAVHAGRSLTFAGLLLALGNVLGIAGRLVAGWLFDRRGWDPLRGVTLLLIGGALGCLLLAANGAPALCLGAALAFGLGASWPGLFQSAVVRHYRQAPAAATGYTQTGAFFGSIVAPLAFGFVARGASYPIAWLLTAAVAVAAAALMVSANARVRLTTDLSIAPIPVLQQKGPDGD
jgi:MFS family permease